MLNWSDIDTVLLDMDGTLLDLYFDNFFWLTHLPKQYAKHKDIALIDAKTELNALSTSLQGHLHWYCVDHWSDTLGLDIESLKAEVAHLIKFRPHTADFLVFLKNLGKQVIVVTNAHPKSLELKATCSGLHQYLDKAISSHEFKLAKENQGFWPKLAQRECYNLDRCLFIDDSVSVLRRAHQEGVKQTIQVLQPDLSMPAVNPSEFLSIIDFDELMTSI